MEFVTVPPPRKRNFLPENFKITVWSKLKPYFNELLARPVNGVEDLEKWILDRSELDAIIEEEFGWRYIYLTTNTTDDKAIEAYTYIVQELSPRISNMIHLLNKKLLESPFCEQLSNDSFRIYLKCIRNSAAIYRKENIPILTQLKLKSKEFGKIFSKIALHLNGKDMTLQQASVLLEEHDRSLREKVYRTTSECVLGQRDKLDDLFDDLLKLRNQVALNAGFSNYRSFKFQQLNRFDYTAKDCEDFHDSIAAEVLPVIDEMCLLRKKMLKVDTLRPWDLSVDILGKEPLKPFSGEKDLIEKSKDCLSQVHPFFGECLGIMNEIKHLDLGSRLGKRPGGYNMPLPITGIPFVFMNAADSVKDMRTMMHEGGHAVHSFLIRDYVLESDIKIPSEVAELAAMSMELLTMDHWNAFFEKEKDLIRAKIWQLEKILFTIAWIAAIDKFQHWIYTHPTHTNQARSRAWLRIHNEFHSDVVDYEGLEPFKMYKWHRQLHIFEAPFYYIEYGMAQLGAIAIWKQYREQPEETIENYIKALSLGYTKSIPEIYQTAGIEFNFSRPYVKSLVAFVKTELEKLVFNVQ